MSRPHNFTEEQLARMFAWRRANRSFAFIARRMPCSIGAVRHQCLLAGAFPIGVKPRVSSFPMVTSRKGVEIRRFTDEEDRIALAMHADNATLEEIGRALGRASGTIRNRILTLTVRQLQDEAA